MNSQQAGVNADGWSHEDRQRAMLLNVLWYHQGGSSHIGQSVRLALGKGQHEHLTPDELAEAKRIDALYAAPSPQQQQEAIATKLETDEFGCFHTDYEGFKRLKALPVGAKIFTLPPEATALAQEVKNRAVEICRNADERDRTFTGVAEEIAAIPIPEVKSK